MTTDNRPGLASGLEVSALAHPQGRTLGLWRGLLEGTLSMDGMLRLMRADPQLTYLTIDTTGVCDLRCPGMCYYHPDIDVKQPHVPLDALERCLADAKEHLNLQSLVFAGKEPLQNMERLTQVARFASRLPGKKLSIGLISNGRGVVKHWQALDGLAKAGALTFMDVSIDSGEAEEHDAIRGIRGTHALAIGALKSCAEAWPAVRVSSASVLRHENGDGILALLKNASAFNRHFFITPIQPPPFTTTAPLAWSHISKFLQQLTKLLETELAGSGIEVMVSLLGLYLTEAERDGFFRWDEIQEDSAGQCYVERMIGGNRFQLHMQVLPETGWRIGRITYTGAYLPNTHFLQVAAPERFAVGHVQHESIVDLYRKALADDSILGKILHSRSAHHCKERPCWGDCFGGLVAAEHSFVGGADLLDQPTLCLKTEADFRPDRTPSLRIP